VAVWKRGVRRYRKGRNKGIVEPSAFRRRARSDRTDMRQRRRKTREHSLRSSILCDCLKETQDVSLRTNTLTSLGMLTKGHDISLIRRVRLRAQGFAGFQVGDGVCGACRVADCTPALSATVFRTT
jgi:hypothetical protein